MFPPTDCHICHVCRRPFLSLFSADSSRDPSTPPLYSPAWQHDMLSITDLGVAMHQAASRGTGNANVNGDNVQQRKVREGTTEARFLPGAVTAATLAVAMLLLLPTAASTVDRAAWLVANTTVKEVVHNRQARQNETACEVADFVPIMAQMPAGCADMILAAASTGAVPSPAEMCGCMVPVDVDDMPGCAFGAVIFDAETHGSCVAMVAAGTAPPTSAPAMVVAAVACEVAHFVPIIRQMPLGCADMMLAVASTGMVPSSEAMCRCIAAVEVADLPGCEFDSVIFDPATHASCVAMVDAGTTPPTSAPATSVTVALPACTTVVFFPILAQMTQLCASILVAAHSTGVLPSDEVLCGCFVDLDPALLPECQWLGYTLDATAHQECVDMFADAGGTFECSPAG